MYPSLSFVKSYAHDHIFMRFIFFFCFNDMNPPVPCHLYASLNPCLLTELTPVNFHCASLLGMIFLFSFSTFGHTALHTGDLQFPGKGSNPCSCIGSTESSTTELPGKYHRQVLILLLYMATILYIYIQIDDIILPIWKSYSNVVHILQQLPFFSGSSYASTRSTRALTENAVNEYPKAYLFQFWMTELFPVFRYFKQCYREHPYMCG